MNLLTVPTLPCSVEFKAHYTHGDLGMVGELVKDNGQ